MKFNKRKFLKNLFFFILFISLVVLGVYLWKTPEARNNIYEYYSEVLARFSDEEIIDVEEVFSISYDPAVQTSIIPGKDGMLVINKNRIAEYTTSKNPVWVKDINVSNPIIATDSNRFVIAEFGGKKIMTFSGRNLIWEMDIPNEIKKVTINEDGHVGVIFSQPGYKSGFLYFSPDGKEIFKKLFANTNLIDADISPKGDIVAMIEADVSSAIISSAISFMSNKGQIVYSEIEDDILLSGIRFVDKDNVIAVGDNRLIKIDKEYNKTIFDDFSGKTVSGINLYANPDFTRTSENISTNSFAAIGTAPLSNSLLV